MARIAGQWGAPSSFDAADDGGWRVAAPRYVLPSAGSDNDRCLSCAACMATERSVPLGTSMQVANHHAAHNEDASLPQPPTEAVP